MWHGSHLLLKQWCFLAIKRGKFGKGFICPSFGEPRVGFEAWGVKFYWLVVDQTPLKNMSSSIGMIILNIWKNKKCSKPPTSDALTCIYESFLWVMVHHLSRFW